jgi:hypothetical protein
MKRKSDCSCLFRRLHGGLSTDRLGRFLFAVDGIEATSLTMPPRSSSEFLGRSFEQPSPRVLPAAASPKSPPEDASQ